MRLRMKRGWEIPESQVTPEAVALGRRAALAGAAFAAFGIGAAAVAPGAFGQIAGGQTPGGQTPAAGGAPGGAAGGVQAASLPGVPTSGGPPGAAAALNDTYKPGRALTGEKYATTYNNYYEFSDSKNLWREAQALPLRPWTIAIDGMVSKPRTIGIDDLFKLVNFEERIYRHRCVETWAMTVPWTGFPLSQLLKIAEPLGSAKYVMFQTAQDPKAMPGLDAPFYPWPYTEGLTMAEAANDLAFLSTGMYGKLAPPQNGAPIRLTVPWKYGFKSAKALVRISFTDKQPTTFWESIGPSEYGFWANVNPDVPHPRWSQASETLLGTDQRVPTQIYNGYGSFVASLYDGLKDQKLFM